MNEDGKKLFSSFALGALESGLCGNSSYNKEAAKENLIDYARGKEDISINTINFFSDLIDKLEEIDKENPFSYETVKKYVYFEHPKVVEEDLEKLPNGVKIRKKYIENCSVWGCEAVDNNRVKHPLDSNLILEVKSFDGLKLEKEAYYTVHWGYVLEKIDKDLVEKINKNAKEAFDLN